MAERSNTSIVLAILVAGGIVAAAVLFSQGGLLKRSEPDPFQGVKAAVAEELFDPASAMFRDVQFDRASAKLQGAYDKVPAHLAGYCGEVNAKNRMGGYVGYKKFHAQENAQGKWLVVYDEKLVSIMCR